MARPISWLPRLTFIRQSVAGSVRSHWARRDLERLFELQPRAAQKLIERMLAVEIGTSRLVEREALLSFLDAVHDADDPAAAFGQARSRLAPVAKRSLGQLVPHDCAPASWETLPESLSLAPGESNWNPKLSQVIGLVVLLAFQKLYILAMLSSQMQNGFVERDESEPLAYGNAEQKRIGNLVVAMQPPGICSRLSFATTRTNKTGVGRAYGSSNTLVLSLTWAPAKAETLDQLVHGGGNLIELLPMAVQAMRANVARSLAVMSGGEYMSFTRQKGFEDRISEMASHARNRYILSFRPTEATPGLHRLEVKLNADVDGRVVARTDYWAIAAP